MLVIDLPSLREITGQIGLVTRHAPVNLDTHDLGRYGVLRVLPFYSFMGLDRDWRVPPVWSFHSLRPSHRPDWVRARAPWRSSWGYQKEDFLERELCALEGQNSVQCWAQALLTFFTFLVTTELWTVQQQWMWTVCA